MSDGAERVRHPRRSRRISCSSRRLLRHPRFREGPAHHRVHRRGISARLPRGGRSCRESRLPRGDRRGRASRLPRSRCRHRGTDSGPRGAHRRRLRRDRRLAREYRGAAPTACRAATTCASASESFAIRHAWRFGEILLRGHVQRRAVRGAGRAARAALSPHHIAVRSSTCRSCRARAAELLRLMPKKAPPDRSRFLLSPMPGLLAEVAVKAGQEVKAGERLVVIEAMKMQNVILAERDAAVPSCWRKEGESLAVDQPVDERSNERRTRRAPSASSASSRSPLVARARSACARCGSTASGSPSRATIAASARTSTRTSRSPAAALARCEVDLMQPIDPARKPAVHDPPLNHVGLWVDDLPRPWPGLRRRACVSRPGGIRKGAAGPRHHIHPSQGQRRVPDRRRRRTDRAGPGAAPNHRRRRWGLRREMRHSPTRHPLIVLQ